jgi:signal transduction histidine kinase
MIRHRRYLNPAVELMDRLKYPGKMAVIASVFSVALIFFMYLLVTEINADVKFAEKERLGATYVQALMKLARDMQLHRGMSNAFLSGDASFKERIIEINSSISNDIKDVSELDRKHGADIPITAEWNAVLEKWHVLSDQVFSIRAEDSFRRHTWLIDDVLSLMVRVADISNLTLDPDIEGFYLMDTAVNRLPLAAEYAGQLRGAGVAAIALRKMPPEEKTRLTILSGLCRSAVDKVDSNLEKVFREDPDIVPLMGDRLLESDLRIYGALDLLEKRVINAPVINIRPAEYFDVFSRAGDAIFELHQAVTTSLAVVLQRRTDNLRRKRSLIEVSAILSFLGTFYLFAGSYLSVTDSLSALTYASVRIGSGDMDVRVSLKARDEMELVAESINDMSMKLSRVMSELKRSNAELEHFAYLASHDLKSPLLAIGSNLKLFQRRYQGKIDAEADKFISDAIMSALRMERLISDLLAYSRVGTQGKPFGPTDCSEALDVSISNLKVSVEESGAEITREALPRVMADPGQLIQLFQNLIGNAIRFCGDAPPRVHISSARKGNEWVFSVRDNGIGIPEEQIGKVFEIFQRAHGEKYEGTGMGLAICKKIVERHGGRLWVESEQGKGSTFYFTIPAAGETEG